MKVAIILEELNKAINLVDEYLDDNQILFELRLDLDQNLLSLFEEFPKLSEKAIITLRSKSEGGRFDRKNRKQILQSMIRYKPKYLDLEIARDLNLLQELELSKIIPILSSHDYRQPMLKSTNEFFEELKDVKQQVVYKFVGNPEDPLDLIHSIEYLKNRINPHIILGIGRAGDLSRTLPNYFSQTFVFGSTNRNNIPSFTKLVNLDNPNAVLTGLIGKSLTHSLSPLIHNLFLKVNRMEGFYHLFEFGQEDRVLEFIEGLRPTSIKGLNITFPYKKAIVPLSDYQSREVEMSGVSNTIKYENEKIHTFNTDISGFKTFLVQNLDPENNSFLIFGAGGAGIAVGLGLLDLGKQVTYVNRSKHRLDTLPDLLKEKTHTHVLEDFNEDKYFDVYINATTLGFGQSNPTEVLPIPQSVNVVIDLNYSKNNTNLINEAIKKGKKTFDGKKMLFHQAADSFEIWTSKKLDRSSYFSKFLEALK